MKDAKDVSAHHSEPNGTDPIAKSLDAVIAKIQTPVDPYTALGVEVARRMQLQNALDAAMTTLQLARDRIAMLEKELTQYRPTPADRK